MAKKFHNPDWKALRKLEHSLQLASFYIWDKADEAGVYAYDEDYLALDLREQISIDQLCTIPGVVKLDSGRVFLTEYIHVNYGQLKPNYNPHKPALRAIEKNKLREFSSLNQAWFKLIKEEEDVIEEEDVKEDAKEKNIPEKIESLFPADPKSKFIPPTVDEVAAEFTKRTSNVTLAKSFAEIFIAHYTNTNWTYGKAKTKMKSWQAAMTSAWKLGEFISQNNGQNKTHGRVEPSGKEFGEL